MGYLHMRRRELSAGEEALLDGSATARAPRATSHYASAPLQQMELSEFCSRADPRASTDDRLAADGPVSADAPDWQREACKPWSWQPSRQVMRALRDYQHAKRAGMLGLARAKFAVLRHRFWSAVSGSDVPLNSDIAGGLMMPHPNGIVVHPDARIGPNCMLFQQVTIGTGPKPGLPELGGHVDVGPGAKILGGVHIGDHAVIGANAVVLSDVPDGCVAVGVPASVKRLPQW